MVVNVSDRLGFSRVDDLRKYLGMSMFHRRVSTLAFQFVIEKARAKLNGWNAQRLLMVGRITFAKSMFLVIPNYLMDIVHIPISVCKEIENFAHKFIWE